MWLLDTSFLIELERGTKGAVEALMRYEADGVCSSSLCWHELWRGARLRGVVAERRARLLHDAIEWLDLGTEEAETAGDLWAHLHAEGRQKPQTDLLIAGQALHHGCTIVTLDGDFDHIPGVEVERPELG